MNRTVYRYTFTSDLSTREVEETLLLAVLAVENLHGASQTRLDASYNFDPEKRACVIDADNDVGRDLCRSFTGFLTREFGERAFRVHRVSSIPQPDKQEVST